MAASTSRKLSNNYTLSAVSMRSTLGVSCKRCNYGSALMPPIDAHKTERLNTLEQSVWRDKKQGCQMFMQRQSKLRNYC